MVAVAGGKGASERGGFRGPIAVAPHDYHAVAHEQAWAVVATDPADPTDTPDAAIERLLTQATE